MPSHYGAPYGQLSSGQTTAAEAISVITLHGDIDYHNIDHLRDVLLFPHGAAAARTVISLSAVTFIDSSGINAFITAHHAAQGSGGWLRLAGPFKSVMHVIRIVGLDGIIPCYPTLQQALAV
ncbi:MULTISPECIES: STAS domain-containing protein [Streptomyces]|uniref:STAS domain-containing protein n=1 Tax=Streptomyces TaxID=1883 RepID=UPI000A92AB22|nr:MULTISPECIES: STAS domain-containing protein [Streptomyces]MDH6223078.1 stage II sporulation protein AA (anti-sigma F factor antagonist) [Streptomyces sp. MJP52]